MDARASHVVAEGFSFLEGPRWDGTRLRVSDFYTGRHIVVSPDGDVRDIAHVPGQPSGSGWLPDGSVVLVSMRDRKLLRLRGAEQETHADLSALAPWHLNDMVVDQVGRAWVGNFGFALMGGAPAATTVLIRVEPSGHAEVVADDLAFPNGMVVTPDGSTLIVAESFAQRLTAFDIDRHGALVNRRPWAVFGQTPQTTDVGEALAGATLVPDGIALDAEGAIWVADAIGGRAVRVREGGEIVDEVSGGGLGVFACALGGADGQTLFLCAAPSFLEHERRDTRDGKLLSVRVDAPRAGIP